MKKMAIIILSWVISLTASGQDITGQWNSILKVQGIQLRLVFHLEKTEKGYDATMDSPDQGAKGMPVSSTTFENSTITMVIQSAKIEYDGVLGKDNMFTGTFRQAGQSFPLNLSREMVEKEVQARPQDPVKPYPYYEEDVTFKNEKAAIELAGTLTLPKEEGVFPAVILITGSGPQNRDEELLGHRPFLVLADYLTRNGIAVLRFDDRGTAASEGDFKNATTLDFSTDVEAGIAYLESRKEINKKKIGLIGHSEGGIIAPIVAAKSKDVAFIVLMAGTGIPGDQLLLIQQELINRVSGMSEENLLTAKAYNKGAFELVKKDTSASQLQIDLTAYIRKGLADQPDQEIPDGMTADEFIAVQVNQLTTPWMRYFIKYDPSIILEKVNCPVLAINGEKDLQVPPKENLGPIASALKKGGNKKVTTKELPGLNHLFQECTTGSPEEYAVIEQTISPVALSEILSWIQGQVK